MESDSKEMLVDADRRGVRSLREIEIKVSCSIAKHRGDHSGVRDAARRLLIRRPVHKMVLRRGSIPY